MDEVMQNMRQNPALLYFGVAFVVLWGGGMLWGLVVVLKHLGKGARSRKALRARHFEEIGKEPTYVERIKDLCLKTLGTQFARRVENHPRPELLNFVTASGLLRLTYNLPGDEYRDLPRATGLKESIQIVGRELVLKRILYRSEGVEACYAETTDTERLRAYQPRERLNSTTGWALCFAATPRVAAPVTLHRKFTGSRKLLMGLAFKVAGATPAAPEGLLPEFADAFDVLVSAAPTSAPPLDEQIQRTILKYKEAFPEGPQLHLAPTGIWFTGEEALSVRQFVQLIELGDELAGEA